MGCNDVYCKRRKYIEIIFNFFLKWTNIHFFYTIKINQKGLVLRLILKGGTILWMNCIQE